MKPHEQVKRRILDQWLDKAGDDLGVAERLISDEGVFANAVAFHCQQAAEKFIKGFLSWSEIDFPKTHDLTELLTLAGQANKQLAADLRAVKVLTPYGVDLRYPGDRPNVSLAQAKEAVELARLVRDKIMPLLCQ
jgi:HEPN domain-containing protein